MTQLFWKCFMKYEYFNNLKLVTIRLISNYDYENFINLDNKAFT